MPGMEPKADNSLHGNQEVDALQKLKQKLKSQTGASITFALLLFLVCAVVGSVVLTAGTAAAGRMSELAKMDQRYYSVTSAAQLLQDIISDQTIEVKDGTASFREEALPQPAFLLDAAEALSGEGTGISGKNRTISLRVDDSTVTIPDVSLIETMDSAGNLILDVCSSKQANDPLYIIRMTFTADKTELIDKNEEKGMETKTTVIRWKLNLLEKGTSDGETGGNG